MYLYEVNYEIDALTLIDQTGEAVEGFEIYFDEEGRVNHEAIDSRLRELYANRDDIIEDMSRLVQNLRAESSMLKSEETRLKDRRKKVDDRITYLEDKISKALDYQNWSSNKSSLKVSFRSSDSLVVDSIDLVDERFVTVSITKSVDKVSAKKAIKSGANLEGCHLETHRNISIK